MVTYTLPAYCQAIEVKPLQVFERREPRSGENETRTYCGGDEVTLLTSTVAGSAPYRPWVARQTYEARVAEYAIGLLYRGRYQKGYADRIRSASAAFTAVLARNAPRTSMESIVSRASSGGTSSAMLARPSTLISSVSPA
jgi:hypothetical protein